MCIILLFLSLSLILGGCAGTYPPGKGPSDFERGLPVFDHEEIQLISNNPELTDLMILVQIPYDNLQFVREKDTFKANYEVMVVITDSTRTVVADHFSTFEVEERNYYQTNSRNIFSHARVIIPLPNGNYDVMMDVTDHESREHRRASATVSIRGGSTDCRLSDLVLVKPSAEETDPRDFTPIAGSFIYMGDKDVSLYFEAAYSGSEPIVVKWALIRLPVDTLSINQDTLHNEQGYCQTRIPLELATSIAGEYSVNLEMVAGPCHQTTTKQFRVQYQDLPHSITNIDDAIEQLRYIATNDEMQSMRKAFHSQKEELFKNFWKERDPTSGTPENEQMIEYYRRVDYTNERFSTQRPGWMTDRGVIYIKYGEPSDIVRNLMPRNQKPYEIWYYDELSLRFDFVDRTGFGDYELMGPISEW